MTLSMLIAHSDSAIADMFRPFCEKNGYQTLNVQNGLECVAMLRHTRPDVIILDQQLAWGGPDGVLARMREDKEMAWAPVIIVCDQTARLSAELLAAPVAYVLRTPCTPASLPDCIEAAMLSADGRRAG
jgi:CheY-like chemotaxis protein